MVFLSTVARMIRDVSLFLFNGCSVMFAERFSEVNWKWLPLGRNKDPHTEFTLITLADLSH